MGSEADKAEKFTLGSGFQFEPKPPTMMASSEILQSFDSDEFFDVFFKSRHKLETEKSLHLEVVIVLEVTGSGSASVAEEPDFVTGIEGVDINILLPLVHIPATVSLKFDWITNLLNRN